MSLIVAMSREKFLFGACAIYSPIRDAEEVLWKVLLRHEPYPFRRICLRKLDFIPYDLASCGLREFTVCEWILEVFLCSLLCAPSPCPELCTFSKLNSPINSDFIPAIISLVKLRTFDTQFLRNLYILRAPLLGVDFLPLGKI